MVGGEGKSEMSHRETRIAGAKGKQRSGVGGREWEGGRKFSITAHADNKDPDFKRL